MTHEDNQTLPEDGDLVGYLDGALTREARGALQEKIARDPALAERLRILQAGGRPFRQAFDAVLDAAPAGRLAAMLEMELRRRHDSGVRQRRLPAWAAIAASLVMLVAGLGAGYGLRTFGVPFVKSEAGAEADSGAWETMLASDLALYSPEGLAMIGPGGAPSDAELAAIGAKLNVTLSASRLALPGLTLKQARLLAFDGAPFAQLVYLDPQHGPVAFCIFASHGGAEAPEAKARAGMNLVYWSSARAGYMLIGQAPVRALQDLATDLVKAFPPESV
jgi:anti-sigma factor RsiW